MLDKAFIRGQGEVLFGKAMVGHITFADGLVIFLEILGNKLTTLGLQINAKKSAEATTWQNHAW